MSRLKVAFPVEPEPVPRPEMPRPLRRTRRADLLAPELVRAALWRSVVMLRPDIQWANPVMFCVELGAVLTLLFAVAALLGQGGETPVTYLLALDFWLWATVLFANFATALAEARGQAQAESLRRTRRDTPAVRLLANGSTEQTTATELRAGDRVVVEAHQIIPGDGEVIEGIASVDESAITGESAPVIREAGGDHSGVTGGTMVRSDRIVVRITARPGESFLDRMIGLVEGSIRQRTPNEIALTLVLSAFTLIFLIVVVPLWPMAWNAEQYIMSYLGLSEPVKSLGTDVPTLVALLVCLIPTTIGALLAAIGIAGMDRALQANIIAKSGKAVETAGDVDTVLLDKTGTITIGNRNATQFIPVGECSTLELGRLAAIASLADETPEGKSVVRLFQKQAPPSGVATDVVLPRGAEVVAFSAQTRMSGVDLPNGQRIRKGAADAVIALVRQQKGTIPKMLEARVNEIAAKGATPLVVADGASIAGVIMLEDILK